jgi:peptidoglycan hydrolase CwlO-like protein
MEQTPLTKQQVIEEIETYLYKTETTYKNIKKNSDRIYNRTTRVIKTVFASIVILLVFNVYFIYTSKEAIISMVTSMNDMYIHFGNMSDQVHGITGSVVKMSGHIEVLPEMAKSMTSMDNTVVNMNANVQLMQSDVWVMSKDIGSINSNITNITYRFDKVTDNMRNIGSDVNQMSRIIPF